MDYNYLDRIITSVGARAVWEAFRSAPEHSYLREAGADRGWRTGEKPIEVIWGDRSVRARKAKRAKRRRKAKALRNEISHYSPESVAARESWRSAESAKAIAEAHEQLDLGIDQVEAIQ